MKFNKNTSKNIEALELDMLNKIQGFIKEDEKLLQSLPLDSTLRESIILSNQILQKILDDFHQRKILEKDTHIKRLRTLSITLLTIIIGIIGALYLVGGKDILQYFFVEITLLIISFGYFIYDCYKDFIKKINIDNIC